MIIYFWYSRKQCDPNIKQNSNLTNTLKTEKYVIFK